MQASYPVTRSAAPDFLVSYKGGLALVEDEVRRVLAGDGSLVEEIASHLLNGGGKKVRPLLVLMSGLACGAAQEDLVPAAAAAELIHMATLIHDDVVDRSVLRRGLPTVNATWGDGAAVLTGDYLFARAFATLAATGDNRLVRVMAGVVNEMSAGEIEQLLQAFNPEQAESDYLRRIYRKTGCFIAACCEAGALLAGAADETVEALRAYGHGIGMSFQIIDDILDLTASGDKTGKPAGNDVRSGVLTLPVLHALAHSPQRGRLAELVRRRELDDTEVAEVRALAARSGGIDYAYRLAQGFTRRALEALAALPTGPHRQSLAALAEYLVEREV